MNENAMGLIEKDPAKNEAIQVLNARNVKFEHPHPDVYVAKIPIANASWVNTGEGTVLIDTLMGPVVAEQMKEKILETGGPVKTIIYIQHNPEHVEAGKLHLLILENLCEQDDCLMSRNSWVYAMEKDKKLLASLSAPDSEKKAD